MSFSSSQTKVAEQFFLYILQGPSGHGFGLSCGLMVFESSLPYPRMSMSLFWLLSAQNGSGFPCDQKATTRHYTEPIGDAEQAIAATGVASLLLARLRKKINFV